MRLRGCMADLLAGGAPTDVALALLKIPSAGHAVRGPAGFSGRAVAAPARAVPHPACGIVRAMPRSRSREARPSMKAYALKKVLAPAVGEGSLHGAMPGTLRRGLAGKPSLFAPAAVFGGTMRGEGHDRSDVGLLVASDSCEDAVEATMGPLGGSATCLAFIPITGSPPRSGLRKEQIFFVAGAGRARYGLKRI